MSKTVEDIGTLKINLLSQAQYEAEVAGGTIEPNELYLTPSAGSGVADVEVNGSSVVSGGVADIELKTINSNSIVGSGDITIQGGASAFFVEAEVTPYADIKDAYDNDEIIICLEDINGNGGKVAYQLAFYNNTNETFAFISPSSTGLNWFMVNSGDTWGSGTFAFASTDTATQLRDGLMSALDWQKLDGIESGAEVNVQSNWSQSDSTADDYIKNKPTIPTITDTYSGTSSNGMSGKAVKSAIDALDGTISGSAGAGKTLTAFSQTDGKVSATFGNISITKSQVSDFPTIPTVNDATLTIQKNGTTVNTFTANASSNVTANISVHDIPSGGTSGQVLTKDSNTDFDASWATPSAGSFLAEYNVTPFADVNSAYVAGKTVLCKISDVDNYNYAYLYSYSPDYLGGGYKAFCFMVSDAYVGKYYVLHENDGWSTLDFSPASTPTAYRISKFDSTAHMNSTDMTSQEVDDFVDALNVSGTSILDMFYPVGSYYETSDTSFDPNVSWGGTWVLETEGQVHVSGSPNGTYQVSGAPTDTSDGGAKTVTLDATMIPAHTHNSKSLSGAFHALAYQGGQATNGIITRTSYQANVNSTSSGSKWGTVNYTVNATHTHDSVGGGQAHNNMQPYIIVNRWHRTA